MPETKWPTVEDQLTQHKVVPGSALERLIRDNQDFHPLRAEEVNDSVGLPPWVRAYWRKQHPETEYRADDPTGGYPRALKNLYAWMTTHHDLQPEPAPAPPAPPAEPGGQTAAAAPALDKVVGPNRRISGAQITPRSETDIRLNYNDPNKIIAASNAIGSSRQAQFYSADGGTTWGQTTLPLVLNDSLHSDPTVDWTSDGTAWATTIGIQGAGATLQLRAYRSNDGGATWTFDATLSGNQTNTDKQMMWVDHSPTSPFKDRIYVIWHNGLPAFVNRRTGPAGAWQVPIQVSGAETTGTAIGGDIKTNSFGDVFAFWPDTGSRKLLVAKSTNGGAQFSPPVTIATAFRGYDIGVPSFASRRALVYLSGAAYRAPTKNLVYAIWTNLTGVAGCSGQADEPGTNIASPCKTRIWFCRSTDGGATWGAPQMINNQASLNDQFNPWLVVDETSGLLVVAYYDTVGVAGRKGTDVWYQTSSDDGVSWSAAVKVTTAETDETSAGADTGNQYGDYIGLSGRSGKFFPSWTDRRSGAREEIWTAAIDTSSGGGDVPVPLYRYWNPQVGDHFYTTNWNELGNGKYGWGYEGVQCYVHTQPVLTRGTEGGLSEGTAEEPPPPTFTTSTLVAAEPGPASFSTAASGPGGPILAASEVPNSFRVSGASGDETIPTSFRTTTDKTGAEQRARRKITIILE